MVWDCHRVDQCARVMDNVHQAYISSRPYGQKEPSGLSIFDFFGGNYNDSGGSQFPIEYII